MPFDCTGTSISITFGILISWWSNHSRFWSWQDNGGLREPRVDPPGTPDTDWPEQLLQTWAEFFGALIFLPAPRELSGALWRLRLSLVGNIPREDTGVPHWQLWQSLSSSASLGVRTELLNPQQSRSAPLGPALPLPGGPSDGGDGVSLPQGQ